MVLYLLKCDFKLELRKIYSVKTGEVACHLLFLKKKLKTMIMFLSTLRLFVLFSAFMHYFDNPGGLIPTWLINWAAKVCTDEFTCCKFYFWLSLLCLLFCCILQETGDE